MIWIHSEAHEPPEFDELYVSMCCYCRSQMINQDIKDLELKPPDDLAANHRDQVLGLAEINDDSLLEQLNIEDASQEDTSVHHCPVCGWWLVDRIFWICTKSQIWHMCYRVSGSLRQLDEINVDLPMSELCQYLVAKYASRYILHPKKMEELVASIFENLGYRTELTCFTRDGGIDMFLHDSKGSLIGVQVKRYKDSIEIGQIRDFLGAMVLNGLTRGIFVTTSQFQSGAEGLRQVARQRGIELELADSTKLFELLKIAQVKSFVDYPSLSELVDITDNSIFRFSFEVHLNSL